MLSAMQCDHQIMFSLNIYTVVQSTNWTKSEKNNFDITSYCCQIFLKSIIHAISFPEHARSQVKGGP